MILLTSPEIYWKEDLFILFSAELTAGVWITVSSTDWASWQTLIRAPVTRAALHITQHQESVGPVSGTNSLQCPHWLHNTYNTPYTYTTLHTPVDSFTFPSELMLIWLKSFKLLYSLKLVSCHVRIWQSIIWTWKENWLHVHYCQLFLI